MTKRDAFLRAGRGSVFFWLSSTAVSPQAVASTTAGGVYFSAPWDHSRSTTLDEDVKEGRLGVLLSISWRPLVPPVSRRRPVQLWLTER